MRCSRSCSVAAILPRRRIVSTAILPARQMGSGQSSPLHKDLAQVLYDERSLSNKCREMGQVIARDYADKDPLFLVTLSGERQCSAAADRFCRTDRAEQMPCSRSFRPLQPTQVMLCAGAFMFASDLIKEVQPVPDGLNVDFIRASSYGAGTSSTGTVELEVRCRL